MGSAVTLLVPLFGLHFVSFFLKVMRNLKKGLPHRVIGLAYPLATFFRTGSESAGFIPR